MSVIYHLTSRAEWERAQSEGEVTAESLRTEGFIHCSTGAQHAASATKHFHGHDDLMLLLIDTQSLASPVKFENGYPHIYGALNIEAVFEALPYAPDANGVFQRHEESYGFDLYDGTTLAEAAAHATEAMRGCDVPWGIAGGWAIDLFLGRTTRPHADIELVVRFADQKQIFEHLAGWDMRKVIGSGMLAPWQGEQLEPHHQVWTRPEPTRATDWREFIGRGNLDLLFEPGEDRRWICRRDQRVTLPFAEVFMRTAEGTPFVRPEIAILFKAKHRRFKDARDFAQVVDALLDRDWLRDALQIAHPGHPWIEALA